MAGKKTGKFSDAGIESLAKDKPVVYEILDKNGAPLYIGVAKKGRVEERIKEHLPSGKDSVRGGKKVTIKQKTTIDEARKAEGRAIKKKQPPRNKKGK